MLQSLIEVAYKFEWIKEIEKFINKGYMLTNLLIFGINSVFFTFVGELKCGG